MPRILPVTSQLLILPEELNRARTTWRDNACIVKVMGSELWWGPDNMLSVTNRNEAGVFSVSQALGMWVGEVPIELHIIEGIPSQYGALNATPIPNMLGAVRFEVTPNDRELDFVITVGEFKANTNTLMPMLHGRRCLIREPHDESEMSDYYWKENYHGYVRERHLAPIYADALIVANYLTTPTTLIEVLCRPGEKPQPRTLPDGRKCLIEQALTPGTIDMVKQWPTHETVRTMMLAELKQQVPPEHDTFEKIRDWIEANIEKRTPAFPVGRAIPARGNTGLIIPLTVTEHRTGRARYEYTANGTNSLEIDRERLLELAGDASSWGELMDFIQEEIGDREYWDGVNWNGREEREYSDHEDDEDSEGNDWGWADRNGTIRQLKELIQQIHPEAYEGLNNA